MPLLLCSLLFAVELYVLVYDFDTSGGTRLSRPVVGKLKFLENQVRSKSTGTIAWSQPEHGDALRNQDTLLTMKNSKALVEFEDGSEFLIDQDSLVVLEKQASGLTDRYQKIVLKLQEGTLVKKSSGGAPVSIMVRGQTIEDASGNARFKLSTHDNQVKIEVESGELKVDGKKTLTSGQTSELGEASKVALETLPVGEDDSVVRDTEKEKVRLAWKPNTSASDLKILVSRTPDFESADEASLAGQSEAEIELENDGQYYWRLATKDGEPASAPREFRVTTRKPPEVTSEDELKAIAGKSFSLEWKAKPKGEIVVEISESEDFSTSETLRVPASKGVLSTKKKKPKTYFWRLSMDYGGKVGTSKPSETRKIVVRPKTLLEAPKVKKPKVRLQSALPDLSPWLFSAPDKDGIATPKKKFALARLSWDKVDGARAYQLQVSKEESFARKLFDKRVTGRNFDFKTEQTGSDKKFFYRVASIDEDGDLGPFSNPIEFVVGAKSPEAEQDDNDIPTLTPEEIRKKVPWRLEGSAGAGYHSRSFKNDVQNPLSTIGAAFIPAFAAFEFRRWWKSREDDSAEPLDTSEIVAGGWFIVEKAEPITPNVLLETYPIPVMQAWLGYEWDQWGARLALGPYAATTYKFSFSGRSAKAERVLLAGAHATFRSSLLDKRAWHWTAQIGVTGMGAVGGDARGSLKMPWHFKAVQWLSFQGFFGELEAFARYNKLETAFGADFKIGYGF